MYTQSTLGAGSLLRGSHPSLKSNGLNQEEWQTAIRTRALYSLNKELCQGVDGSVIMFPTTWSGAEYYGVAGPNECLALFFLVSKVWVASIILDGAPLL